MFELDGRVALVTGAAKGIGRRTAEYLHRAGATVIVSDIDADGVANVAAQLGTGVRSVTHDVTSPESWKDVVDGISAAEGHLNILVNNAGVILSRPFLETTLADFRRVHSINVEGVFIGMQACVPLMQRTASKTSIAGSIINLSSIYGQVVGKAHSAYCSSKGAVRLLTKAVAVELARAADGKIRVNSVHPGPTETDLGMSGLHVAVAQGLYPSVEAALQQSAAAFPLGRWGTVDDIAGAILFLASDASKFVTGAELTVDGGYSVV